MAWTPISETDNSDSTVQKNKHVPVKLGLLHTVLGVFFEAFKARDKRVEALEARLAELESRPTMADAYQKVWESTRDYSRGHIVTWGGSMWHSNVNHNIGACPGQSPVNWTLAVKRGADGRKAK